MSDREDFTIRCSSLNRLPRCQGYQSLIKQIDTGTKYTRSGTLGHLWLESWVKSGCQLDVADSSWFQHVADVRSEGELSEEPEKVLEYCHDFANWFLPTFKPHNNLFSTEREVSYQGDGFRLVGHTDLTYQPSDDRLVVCDYKFYSNPDSLPNIEEDLQMMAYAWISSVFGTQESQSKQFQSVTVRRLLVKQCKEDCFTYNAMKLAEAAQRILNICDRTVKNASTFTVGDHCGYCLARNGCPDFLSHASNVPTGLQPYRGGKIVSNEQAIMVANAIPAAETVLSMAKEALREYVKTVGPIKNTNTGKTYQEYDRFIEVVDDHCGILEDLLDIAGKDATLKGMRVSKTKVMECCKVAGYPQKLAKNLLDKYRREGKIKRVKQTCIGWK